jgi:hypothetical protein
MKGRAVLVLGKELRRYPGRGRKELAARAAAAHVACRLGAIWVATLEGRLRGQQQAGSAIVCGLLVELGLERDRVVARDWTASTRQELCGGLELVKERGADGLVVITSAYHVPRTRRYLGQLAPESRFSVLSPEAFLRWANPREKEWIVAGTPDAEALRRERGVEARIGRLEALLSPLPVHWRSQIEIAAGKLFRLVV